MKFAKGLGLAVLLTLGLGTMALAAGPNIDCPDADGDGICNGQDPDYVPCTTCNPDCPDADGDGICNGQDPDYAPPRDRQRIWDRIHIPTRDQIRLVGTTFGMLF